MGSLRKFVSKFKYDKARIGTVDQSSGVPVIQARGRSNNYVYIRILTGVDAGTLSAARNMGAAPLYDTQVRILRDSENGEWVIKEIDPAFHLANPLAAIYSAVFHRHSIGSGLDDPVELRRLIPGRVWSSGGLTINVDGFPYSWNGVTAIFPGVINYDISSFVPGSGLQTWLRVGVDPTTNTLVVAAGTPISLTLPLILNSLLSIAFTGYGTLAGVQLRYGQTILLESSFLDVRTILGFPNTNSGLTVEEEDGTPTVVDVNTIKVSNGTLTDHGSGVVSIGTGGGGGGGSTITKTTKTFYQRTVLYDNTLGSAGTWDVSGIDQTYDHLELLLMLRGDTASVYENVNITFNNDTNDNNYSVVDAQLGDGIVSDNVINNVRIQSLVVSSGAVANRFAMMSGKILNYTNTSVDKILQTQQAPFSSDTSGRVVMRAGVWKSTSAINRIAVAVLNADSNFVTGSRFQIVGVKNEAVVTDVSGAGTVQFTQTSTVTVSNTTIETTLVGAGVGSVTFAANALNAVGRTLRLKMWGILSDLGISPGNLTVKLKLGSTVLVTSGAVALTAGLTNALWELEFVATVRSTGATGTILTNGVLRIVNTLADTVEPLTNGTSTITIDFTGSLIADVTATFSVASVSNAITTLNAVLEVLN